MKCKSALIRGLIASLLVAGAGFAGFRLNPDSQHYATGHLLPSPVGGLIGHVGGMTALVIASALAAGLCFALLPHGRAALRFAAFGGFWFLFPGVDALGVALVAVADRAEHRLLFVPATLATHAVAALGLLRPLLAGAAAAAALMIGFTIDGELRHLGVGAFEHLVYTTRYLVPICYLMVARTA